MQAKSMIVLCVIATLCIWSVQSQLCPPSNTVTNCRPSCKANSECLSGLCCPDICQSKSCVEKSAATKGNSGYKQGISGGTGNYCGNSKCSANEQCITDPKTNQLKCSRH